MSHQDVPTTMIADLERLGCTSQSQSCTERLAKFASRNFFDLFLASTGLADIIAWRSRAWHVGLVTSNLVSCLTLANKLLLKLLVQAIYCILFLLRTNMTDLQIIFGRGPRCFLFTPWLHHYTSLIRFKPEALLSPFFV